MSPNLTPRHTFGQIEPLAAERTQERFLVQLELRYQIVSAGERFRGSGRTCYVSATQVVFLAGEDVPQQGEVELSLDWPVQPDGVRTLQLKVFGTVVRRRDRQSIVRIARHEVCIAGLLAEQTGEAVVRNGPTTDLPFTSRVGP